MHSSTVHKIDHLNRYVEESYEQWKNRYPEDLVGMHVGHKVRKGEQSRYYAIVFHVRAKRTRLPATRQIPDTIAVDIPGQGQVEVPTDVVETGDLMFCTGEGPVTPGQGAVNVRAGTYGSIGPIVYDAAATYVLSNMHVLGGEYMRKGYFEVDAPFPERILDITLSGDSVSIPASFERGTFGGNLDVAIARVGEHELRSLQNTIPDSGVPTGLLDIGSGKYTDYEFHMYGNVSGRKVARVTGVKAVKDVLVYRRAMQLHDLIQLAPVVCVEGDSGCPLYDSRLNVVGVIVGYDSKYSYAVNIKAALRRLRVKLLTNLIEQSL